MIVTAKMNLPPERPLHLFGAGHPFMFALAVALGCDLFDSAAYALFARQERYLTESGTTRLEELQYFPCSCPVCNKTDPETVRALPREERHRLLAEHNLHISFCELRCIKQAVSEGRLWEHMEMRAHGHPSLLQALKKVAKYRKYLELQSPVTRKGGIFFFSSLGLARPEVVRYRQRLVDRYSPPPKARVLLLLPQTLKKPFHTSKEQETVMDQMWQILGDKVDTIHVCTYAAPFGVVPTELDDVYPVSQNVIAYPFDHETVGYVAQQVADYIKKTSYEQVILLQDPTVWNEKVGAACRQACKKRNVPFIMLSERDPWADSTIEQLVQAIQDVVASP
jgi:7-cyano-7-deazaguanine tRNA-ribosyltransferase